MRVSRSEERHEFCEIHYKCLKGDFDKQLNDESNDEARRKMSIGWKKRAKRGKKNGEKSRKSNWNLFYHHKKKKRAKKIPNRFPLCVVWFSHRWIWSWQALLFHFPSRDSSPSTKNNLSSLSTTSSSCDYFHIRNGAPIPLQMRMTEA